MVMRRLGAFAHAGLDDGCCGRPGKLVGYAAMSQQTGNSALRLGLRPVVGKAWLWALAGSALLCASQLWAGPELRSREWALDGFKPPPRWEVTPRDRPSYPQLIAWASRGDGQERAVISLVGKRVAPGTTVRDLLPEASAIKSLPRLENLRVQILSTVGWAPGWTGNLRLQVDAIQAASGKERAQVIRQHLFVNGSIAYTMTLMAPLDQATARLRDLDDTASGLTPLDSSPSATSDTISPSATPPDAGTARPDR